MYFFQITCFQYILPYALKCPCISMHFLNFMCNGHPVTLAKISAKSLNNYCDSTCFLNKFGGFSSEFLLKLISLRGNFLEVLRTYVEYPL